ncbi:MAG: hydroxyacid dehydrogenase [bacterium]
MDRPVVAFFEIEDWERDHLNEALRGRYEPLFFQGEVRGENVREASGCQVISTFIYSRITADLLGELPAVKLMATRSTGFDHIDLEACKSRGVTVCNVPLYGENTVAEHTFALILAISRNVHKAYIRTIRSDFSLKGLRGFDLKGRTIGVIGAGHIGLHVIRMAKGFGMNVLAFDVRRDDFLAEVLGFRYVTLEELLGNSDIISLHAPYNKHTHHMINRDTIKLIKRGAILINTARGGLVDTDALIYALDKGILRGAGLDALEGEELIREEKQILSEDLPQEKLKSILKNSLLMHREDVVITPHIAFYSEEALRRILETTIENIDGFFSGKPKNIVGA